ncbi:MAG: hypothetical protein KJ062_08575 [Thermoanaerobaculia bacterium]|nr:hypothetical protein [Thermoanaerobaculia bacterium]
MRAPFALLSLAVFVSACGGPGEPAGRASPDPAEKDAARAESRRPAPAQPARDPCAPLRAKMVRHDTAGTPFAFTFEMPEGFTVKDISQGEMVGADLTFDLDGKGGDDYVLRLAYSTKVLENPEGLVEVWRKLPMTEKVLEKDVDGRTMYVHRASIGDSAGFTVLFPAPGSATGAHSVLGGMTSTPKPCRAEGAEVLERIVMSYERNPRVSEMPAR